MKKYTYQEIQRLAALMAEELRESGLSERSIKIREINLDDFDDFDVDDAHRWISDIRNGPFAAVQGIRTRHPAQTWANFKALGTKGLPEQKELKTRLQNLRKAWQNGKPEILFRAAAGKARKATARKSK
jgi:hypothetical protein